MSQLQTCLKGCLNLAIKMFWWVQKYVTWKCICISKRNCERERKSKSNTNLAFSLVIVGRRRSTASGTETGTWHGLGHWNPSGNDSTKASGLCSHLRHSDLFSFTSAGITLQRMCYGEEMELETSLQGANTQGSGISSEQVSFWFGSTGMESCLELEPQRQY